MDSEVRCIIALESRLKFMLSCLLVCSRHLDTSGLADCHYMDKKPSVKEASEDVIRESLIAISYSVPDKVLTSKQSSENLNVENLVEGIDCDGADKYRSELISISYSQSPEIKALPALLGEIKG
ncbi:hypothetical protein L1049_019231 [Liquidambar formosana]|uniref:Uncharacterized protein n=1 Tax=Liquidambar formosana TaxID=63359 RepID=A0AAP0RB67_LIQFO